MFAPGLHPLYAAGGIAILAVVGDLVGRTIPFYRRELVVESHTRLTPVDGLRGILCFAVMFHHAAITHAFLGNGQWVPSPSVFYTLLGQTAVALFFCITAFLFWGRALDRGGDIPVFAFLRGRWFRIVPLYVFTAAVVLTLLRKQIHWSHHATWWSLADMGLMGLHLWQPIGGADLNYENAGVTWTLQFEWMFYWALPALAMLIKAGKPARIFLIVLTLWLIDGLGTNMDLKVFFVIGILAAHVARMPRTAKVLRHFLVAIPLLAVMVVMPLCVGGGYEWKSVLFTAAIFIPIACGNSLFGILNYSGLRMLGTISYSVYLLHGIFLLRSRPYLRTALHKGDWQYWLAVLGVGCVVIVGCSLTYAFVEWPFIHLEKRFRNWRRRDVRVQRQAAG